MRGNFTNDQRAMLLEPIQPFRVQELDGISHLAAWDVTAHLNRMFGFEGWDKQILNLDVLYEHVGTREVKYRERGEQKTRTVAACSVGYRCTMRLTIYDAEGNVVRQIEDAATGTAKNQRDLGDAHDLAIKSAVSYALKRCAKDLGDQFGLSLYNKGQESAVVQRVFAYGHDDDVKVTVQGDGITEGDGDFGGNRGEDAPVEQEQPEPVREPEPAKPKATEKPEPTPPPEKPELPKVETEQAERWRQQFYAAETTEQVREVWREVQNSGALDVMVTDLKSEQQMTLREIGVARNNEITAAA